MPTPCTAGLTCPSLRETWREGQLCRLRCESCGWTCSAPALRSAPLGTGVAVLPAQTLPERRSAHQPEALAA
jgi:hypothetical protein